MVPVYAAALVIGIVLIGPHVVGAERRPPAVPSGFVIGFGLAGMSASYAGWPAPAALAAAFAGGAAIAAGARFLGGGESQGET